MKLRRQAAAWAGFSLVELLVVLAVVTVLVALGGAAWQSAREHSRRVQCLHTLRSLGQGLLLYASDHGGELPRSYHSAGAQREPGWASSVMPYLGEEPPEDYAAWGRLFNRRFRCPADPNRDPSRYSYGLNVYFELDPEGDSYPGSPRTYRRISSLAYPARTILLAEVRPEPWADHFMCHLWRSATAARNALAVPRHRRKNHFLFADGAARPLTEAETYPTQTGAWNPWHPEGLR